MKQNDICPEKTVDVGYKKIVILTIAQQQNVCGNSSQHQQAAFFRPQQISQTIIECQRTEQQKQVKYIKICIKIKRGAQQKNFAVPGGKMIEKEISGNCQRQKK